HITDTIEMSVFYRPFKVKPATISQQDWEGVLKDAKSVITNKVIPSYRAIKAFFEQEYFPKARKTLGVSETLDGRNYYAALVKHHTTTNLSPDSIYHIGMNEVTRIRKEMESIITEVK